MDGEGMCGWGSCMAEGSLHGPSTVGKWAVCMTSRAVGKWDAVLCVKYFCQSNSIRVGGPTCGLVTKTVHKTLPKACCDLGDGAT